MSRVIICKCDRCGSEIKMNKDSEIGSVRITLNKARGKDTDAKTRYSGWEFCPECIRGIAAFIERTPERASDGIPEGYSYQDAMTIIEPEQDEGQGSDQEDGSSGDKEQDPEEDAQEQDEEEPVPEGPESEEPGKAKKTWSGFVPVQEKRRGRDYDTQKMVNMKKNGATYQQIAKEIGCSPATVLKVLKKEGV